MTVTTRDGLIASFPPGPIALTRSGPRASVAFGTYSTIDLAGQPGAGVLAGTSVAAGVVPTDATAGCPTINAFGGSNTGYLDIVSFGANVQGRLKIADMLFKAGAYPFNATQTLAAQPSYSSRIPGGDYKGTEIWVEFVTAFTGNPTITVTYTDDLGNAGHSTGAFAIAPAPTVGRMFKLPLQTGDNGVQKIESVTCTVATVGTFNVLVLRPLWTNRIQGANGGAIDGPDRTGMPVVFTDSAFIVQSTPDSTLVQSFDLYLTIGNG